MPARIVRAGFNKSLDGVASSRSEPDGSASGGAPGGESSGTSGYSSSGASPQTAAKPTAVAKGSPQASSHGTPAAGSVHLDVAASASGGSTVSYADQSEIEMAIDSLAACRRNSSKAHRAKPSSFSYLSSQQPQQHQQQPQQLVRIARGGQTQGGGEGSERDGAPRIAEDLGGLPTKATTNKESKTNSAAYRSSPQQSSCEAAAVGDDGQSPYPAARRDPGGTVMYREGSRGPSPAVSRMLTTNPSQPPNTSTGTSRSRPAVSAQAAADRRRRSTSGYGLARNGGNVVLPCMEVGAVSGSKRRNDDDDSAQRQPPTTKRASTPVRGPQDATHVSGASPQQLEAILAARIAQEMAKMQADMANQIATAMQQHTTALQAKDHQLSTAHRVHDQLRAEVRDAESAANSEHALAHDLRQVAASAKHELAKAQSEHDVQMLAKSRATDQAEYLARASAEAEAEK